MTTIPADVEDRTYDEAFKFIRLNLARLRSYELLWILERWDWLDKQRRNANDDQRTKRPDSGNQNGRPA